MELGLQTNKLNNINNKIKLSELSINSIRAQFDLEMYPLKNYELFFTKKKKKNQKG